MSQLLQIRGLRKTFAGHPPVVANAGVDLDVDAGEVIGLLGHNGAGKSTLVNQVVGLLRPDAGTIVLAGVDAIALPQRARQLCSVQAQSNVPITGLTPSVAVNLVGRLRGGDRAEVARRTTELIDALDLGPWADTPAEKVSGGIARLTAFAMTAVAPGRLVVLDEPTNDVDPVRRRLLWEQIRDLADRGAGVLLVTHNVREAEAVVDRLAILDHGSVLAAGTVAQLTDGPDAALTLEVETVPGRQPCWPDGVPVVEQAHRCTARVAPSRGSELIGWAERERRAGRIERFALTPRSLEDAYIELVSPEEVAA